MKIIKNIFISLSVSANLLCLSFLWMMLKIGDEKYKIEESREYYLKNLQCVKLENVVDSISYASQLGRLDTISLLLATFAIILGFGAVAGFMYIKEGSRLVAKEEAEDWLSKKGQTTIYEYLKKNPDVIEKAINQTDIIEKIINKRMDAEFGKPKNLNNKEGGEFGDIKWEPEY